MLFEVYTIGGGYIVGSFRNRTSADTWATDYLKYRGIECVVKEKADGDGSAN